MHTLHTWCKCLPRKQNIFAKDREKTAYRNYTHPYFSFRDSRTRICKCKVLINIHSEQSTCDSVLTQTRMQSAILAQELDPSLNFLVPQHIQDLRQDTQEEAAPEHPVEDATPQFYAFPYPPPDAPYQDNPLGHVNIKDPKGTVLDLNEKFVYPGDALLLTLRRSLGLPVYVRPEKIEDTQWLKLLMVCVCVCGCMCVFPFYHNEDIQLLKLLMVYVCVCMYVFPFHHDEMEDTQCLKLLMVCVCVCMYVFPFHHDEMEDTQCLKLLMVCVCVYMCMYVCMYVCMHVRMYIVCMMVRSLETAVAEAS
jgi:hypothetical protein